MVFSDVCREADVVISIYLRADAPSLQNFQPLTAAQPRNGRSRPTSVISSQQTYILGYVRIHPRFIDQQTEEAWSVEVTLMKGFDF